MPPASTAQGVMAAPTNAARPQPFSRLSHTPGPQNYPQHFASPAPAFQRAASGQAAAFPPATPQQTPAAPLPRTATHPSTYTGALPPAPSSTNFAIQPPRPATSSYRDPPPIEVYTLPDAANASIPPEIREQFDRDEQGRVLFFTAPPVQVADDLDQKLGHSVKYLAAKSRRAEETARKRKAHELAKAESQQAKKKAKLEEAKSLQIKASELRNQALEVLQDQLVEATKSEMVQMYGEEWKSSMERELNRFAQLQKDAMEKRSVLERHERERLASRSVQLDSAGALLGG